MNRHSNLPPGCLAGDIDGEAMPRCDNCGEEHNDWQDNGLCEDCQSVEEEADEDETDTNFTN